MAEAEAHRFLEPDFLARLDKLRLVAKRLSWGMARGEHPTVHKGFSLEFSDYRKYSRGDDLRYVDWNVYGRLERLLLKVFTAEEEITVYLLLDASLSMGEGSPAKLDFAKNVAAALGYIGLKTHDRVGAAALAEDLTAQLPPARARRQILSLFNFLAELSCAGRTDLEASVKTFTRLYPRPGLVVLFSDLLDAAGCRAALEELARKRHDVLLVHVLKEGETRLDPGGDVSLIDVETGRERRVFLDRDLADRFHREVEDFFAATERFCEGREMDYRRTTSDVPFDDFVLRYLTQQPLSADSSEPARTASKPAPSSPSGLGWQGSG